MDIAAGGIREPVGGKLVLSLLGDFEAEIDKHKIVLATRKAKALTAYLALSDNAQDTRERLVGLLWSESDEERARASLRQAVHDIKLAFDSVQFPGFQINKQTLSLVREHFVCDVEEVLAAVSHEASCIRACSKRSASTRRCLRIWTMSIPHSPYGCWPSVNCSMIA